MKKLTLIIAITMVMSIPFSGTAMATSYTFNPGSTASDTASQLWDLDHSYAYYWNINTTGMIGANEQIDSATLTFNNIWDWAKETNDVLYVNLEDGKPKTGGTNASSNAIDTVWRWYDNQASGNYFLGTGLNIGQWNDPQGGQYSDFDLTFDFTPAQLSALAAYINNDKIFGIAFDPDCHYYNDGIKLEIKTTTNSVPETGTLLMIGSGLIGLGFFSRRRK